MHITLMFSILFQIDRTKKPLAKFPDDHRPKSESTAIDKQLIENGRMVPDRSTKPVFDGTSVLTDEERSRIHAETAALLEKSKQEKELRERQQEEQREKLKWEKLAQEQKAKEELEEKENREKLRQAKDDEGREQEEQASKEQEEKEAQERTRKAMAEGKKTNKTEPETTNARKPELDKIALEEKEKGTRTPEMQRQVLGDVSSVSATGVSVSSKVSKPEVHLPLKEGRTLLWLGFVIWHPVAYNRIQPVQKYSTTTH